MIPNLTFLFSYCIAGKPFERVPVLDVDGTEISGSINIVRYLGMTFGK